MAEGPGKYDEFCVDVMQKTQAETVILIVFNGNRGTGFSVNSTDPTMLADLPGVLDNVSAEMRADIAAMRTRGSG